MRKTATSYRVIALGEAVGADGANSGGGPGNQYKTFIRLIGPNHLPEALFPRSGIILRCTANAMRKPLERNGAMRRDLAWVTNTVTLIYGERDAILVDTFLSGQHSKEPVDWVVESG